jgi:hypothetical protein
MKLFKGAGLSMRNLALVGTRTLASAAVSSSLVGVFLLNVGWPALEKRLNPRKKGKKRRKAGRAAGARAGSSEKSRG